MSVYAADIERQKENVKPVRTGRDASSLKAMSELSERAKKELVRKQREGHVERIEKLSTGTNKEGLLDAWWEYINWARQALTNGGKSNEFALLLNDCIRVLGTKDLLKEYAQNHYFVRICVEFVDYCDSPIEFVTWMERRQIGLGDAKFWLTKARVLEDVAKNVAGAQGALQEGIRRNAAPVDKLKAKQRQLEARVANQLLQKSAADDDSFLADDQQRRTALGALASSSGFSGIAGSASAQTVRRDNRKLQIATEEDALGKEAAAGDWVYGSQREAVKENADVARQWSRTTMPQKMSAASLGAASARPAWQILEDGVDEDDAPPPPPVAAHASVSAPAKPAQQPAGKCVEMFRVAEDENALLFGGKLSKATVAVTAAKVEKLDPKKERPIYSEDSLADETTTFEELRAARWHASNRARLEQERADQARREQVAAAEAASAAAMRKKDDERKRSIAAAATKPVSRLPSKALLDESRFGTEDTLDTVNYESLVRNAAKTTNLMDDLQNVFDGTIDVTKRAPRRKTFAREPTINTRLVMDEVEKMFGNSLTFNDSMVSSGSASVAPVAAPLAATAAAPAISSKCAKNAKADVEVYEEDSLESFRLSMSRSAIGADLKPTGATKPVAAPAPTVFEVFCDGDDDDDGDADDGAPSTAAAPPVDKSNDSAAALKQHISFHPMSPIAEERQSSSDDMSAVPSAAQQLQQQMLMPPPRAPVSVAHSATSNAPVELNNPWARLSVVPTSKLATCAGFIDHGAQSSKLDDSKYFELDDGGVFDLSHQIGGGVESNVYRSEDVDNLDGETVYALKITRPASAWEFYLHRQLQRRCSADEMLSFGHVVSFHRFADKGLMFSVYREHGTLATLLDVWKGPAPEEVAIHYAVELLQLVELLHAKRVLHNDITVDNVLLSIDSPQTQRLELIDFSCAIDLADVDANSVFRGRGRCTFQCPEMAAGAAWTFQQDYANVANTVHTLLYGTELRLVQRADRKYEPANKPRPGMRAQLWDEFFLTLLNGPALRAGQYAESVAFVRPQRESVDRCARTLAQPIKALMAKQTMMLYERK